MENLKLKIFKAKNSLTLEQLDAANILQLHVERFDDMSEKEIVHSLRESLNSYTFYPEVKALLEEVEQEIESMPLIYELKDLYKKVERQNHGLMYRPCLNTLLEIINRGDDDARMSGILNELTMYDYVPDVKRFLLKIHSSPIERQNLQNSGKASKVNTIVEKVEEGHLAFVCDRWFLISESEIKQVLADDYIKDEKKLREIRLLEQVMTIGTVDDEQIKFQIDENLELGISTKKKAIYLNGEKLDNESTLESLFNSPIVPYLKRNFYVLAEATLNNIDKFMELDVALKVVNLLNPHNESFVFNYKDKMYMYQKDARYGSKFYAYENVTELIHDVQKDLDYDLSHFYENKLSKELKHLRTLEDKEQSINMKLKDVNESIEMLHESGLLEESKDLELTFKNLLIHKHQLTKELNTIKAEKSETRKTFVK